MIRSTTRWKKDRLYKAPSIAQGCNTVRRELGLETSYVPAADPALQIDVVPKTPG